MICDKCGLPLLGTETFCPQCGARLGVEVPGQALSPTGEGEAPETVEPEAEPEVIEAHDLPVMTTPLDAPRPRATRPVVPPVAKPGGPRSSLGELRQRLVGPMGLGMLAGCLVFIVVGLAILGVAQGLRLRGQKQAESAGKYYEQGMAYMQEGNYDLAIGAFEYALRLRPNYPDAQQKLEEARAKVLGQSTPAPGGQTGQLLSEGRTAYDQGSWEVAIQKLEALRALDPAYEQATVSRLLVGAYTNDGVRLANEDRMEEAIRRFDQALALQPGNPDVEIQRRLATLYQTGLSAWDANWPEVIKSLSALHSLRPDYKDATQRLQRAYVFAGDAAGGESKWCDALDYYKMALTMASTPELAAKRDEAARLCASPSAPGTAVPAGTFVGIYGGDEPSNADWGKVHGTVRDVNGNPVQGIKVKISAYDWVAHTNTDGNGYYVFEALSNDITFTVTLEGVPAQPIDVKVTAGRASIANFQAKL